MYSTPDITEKMLLAVSCALPDPMFIIDIDGTYVDIIGGAERSLYDSSRFLIGKRLHDILPEPVANRFLNTIKKAIRLNRLQTVEYELSSSDCFGNRSDGPAGKQWFEGRISPIRIDCYRTPCVVWVAINISDRKRTERELKRFSEIDELTGANNRRYFMRAFEYELNRFKRHHSPAAIAMMDIDHFKDVNDTYGHPCGDKTLVEFVRMIKLKLRKTDIFARIGGEEFALLMVNTNLSSAEIMIQRLLREIKQMKITFERYEFAITVSIGLTEILQEDESICRPMSRADNALYKAKTSGRACIRMM